MSDSNKRDMYVNNKYSSSGHTYLTCPNCESKNDMDEMICVFF